MISRLFLIALLCIGQPIVFAQSQQDEVAQEKEALPKPYNPEEDGLEKINELLKQAQKKNKKLLIQIGGNWCIWCLRFNHLVTTDPKLKKILDKNRAYKFGNIANYFSFNFLEYKQKKQYNEKSYKL